MLLWLKIHFIKYKENLWKSYEKEGVVFNGELYGEKCNHRYTGI